MTDLNKDGLVPGQDVDHAEWGRVENAHRVKTAKPAQESEKEVVKFDRAPVKKRGS